MNNQELINEYLGTLNIETTDGFRLLLYKASKEQLESISERYERASGLNREWMHYDGVQANMIKWLGEELILISLYHTFEIKIKEIIGHKLTLSNNTGNEENNQNLHRWDALKNHIPAAKRELMIFSA